MNIHRYVTLTPREDFNTCGNLPPRVAFTDLPKRPGLPTWVDPDDWLEQINGRYYRRRVNSSGTVSFSVWE